MERADGVLERRIGDTVLLLPVGSGELRRLEGAAAAVWLVLEQPITVAELAAGACAAAGRPAGDPEVVAHLDGALDALLSGGLLNVAPGADG